MSNGKQEKIIELKSSQKFVDFLDLDSCKDKLIVIDFYAPWCGPCLKLGDFLHKLLETESAKTQYKDVIFVKINIDQEECQELVEKFNVTSIPRVIMLKNKVIVQDMTGYNPKELVNNINKLISSSNKSNTSA